MSYESKRDILVAYGTALVLAKGRPMLTAEEDDDVEEDVKEDDEEVNEEEENEED